MSGKMAGYQSRPGGRKIGRPAHTARIRGHISLLLSIMISITIQVIGIIVFEPINQYDSKEYLSISGSLYRGEGYAITRTSFKGFEAFKGEAPTRMRQPGYPLYLLFFYWMVGQKAIVVQASQLALNVFTFYLVFRISLLVFGPNLWRGTFILLALYFPLWLTSAFIMTETLFTFMLALFMITLLMAIRDSRNPFSFGLAGIVLGLTSLIRPVGFPLALISLVPIVAYGRRLGKSMLLWGILVAVFFTALLPWALRNRWVLGEFTFLSTDGGYNIWWASVGDEEPKFHESPEFRLAVKDGYYFDREANARFMSLALERIRSDPVDYVARGIKRVLWVWSYFPGSQNVRDRRAVFAGFTVIQVLLLFFSVVGILTVERKVAAYLSLPAIGLSCIMLFTLGTSRYVVPSMPFVLLLCGQGLWWLKEKMVGEERRTGEAG